MCVLPQPVVYCVAAKGTFANLQSPKGGASRSWVLLLHKVTWELKQAFLGGGDACTCGSHGRPSVKGVEQDQTVHREGVSTVNPRSEHRSSVLIYSIRDEGPLGLCKRTLMQLETDRCPAMQDQWLCVEASHGLRPYIYKIGT